MNLQPFASQLALRVALFILALLICGAVLVIGVSYLAQALYQGLLPLGNAAIASAATALLCLAPALWLTFALSRRAGASRGQDANSAGVRELVRENPWETLGAAFILGISQSSRSPLDPEMLKRLVSLLEQDDSDGSAKH